MFRACDSRKYTYYFPSYLLLPPKPGSNLHRVLSQHIEASGYKASSLKHPFWSDLSSPKDLDLQKKRAWRADQGQIEKLRATARKFLGTHNFHNFTVGRDASDKSNMRHIKSVEVRLVRIIEISHSQYTVEDCRSCDVWRDRVDKCTLSWPEFYASPSE